MHVSGLRGVRQQSSAGLCLDQRTPVSRRLALMWFLMIMWKWTIQLHWLHERETITWCDYKYGAASTRGVKSWCTHISNVLAKLSRGKYSYNFVDRSYTQQSALLTNRTSINHHEHVIHHHWPLTIGHHWQKLCTIHVVSKSFLIISEQKKSSTATWSACSNFLY